jgi:hypothetical protein
VVVAQQVVPRPRPVALEGLVELLAVAVVVEEVLLAHSAAALVVQAAQDTQ